MLSYTMHFTIPASEVSPCHTITPYHLLNMLQNAADGAVEAMGLPSTTEFGCAWMLHQYSIHLVRPLMKGQQGTINTGHIPLNDLYSIRRFVIYDDDGAQIGQADSSWILVDIQRRRPCRLSRKLPKQFFDTAEAPFEAAFTDPGIPERQDLLKGLDVRLGDLDENGHVNNAHYLSWVSEAILPNVYMASGVAEAHIIYKHEATYGMNLQVISQCEEHQSFRHVIHNQDGTEIARAFTRWESVKPCL